MFYNVRKLIPIMSIFMSMSNLNIRIDNDLKNQAKTLLEGYGITPSQAVKMLFKELVATRKFPLSLSYQSECVPNVKTLAAMRELDNGEGTLYENFDDFLVTHDHAKNQD